MRISRHYLTSVRVIRFMQCHEAKKPHSSVCAKLDVKKTSKLLVFFVLDSLKSVGDEKISNLY